MTTLKEIWKEASKKYPSQIKKKDYTVIIVSSAVSAGVSFLAGRANWDLIKITNVFLIDLSIVLVCLSVVVFIIVSLFLSIISLLNIFGNFCSLVWKKWNFGK